LLYRKAVEWFGPPDLPHALTYLGDFARGLVTLGERDEAVGEVWHIPAAEPLTGRQFIALAAQVAGVPPKMAVVSPLLLRTLGLFSPVVREMVEMRYEFVQPYLLDGTKFTRAFGFTPTPHRDALAATIAWYQASKGAQREITNPQRLVGGW
jgi:nucleoside-diphosphate-sugar epimerase